MSAQDYENLADALDCFWNAGIGAAHDRQSSAAMDTASVVAEGLQAVATRLREHGRELAKAIPHNGLGRSGL